MFFVLSGYLITRILRDEIARTGGVNLKAFFIKRIVRLAPAFCTVLVFSLVMLLFASKSLMPDIRPIVAAGLYLMNWSKAFHLLPDSVLDHTWSLAIEEQFYLLWPFCMLVIARRKKATLVVGTIAALVLLWRTSLVLSGHDDARTYHAFDVRCDGLLIGCGLALATVSAQIQRFVAKYAFVPCVAMAVFMLTVSARHVWVQSLGLSLAPAIAGILLLAAMQPGPLNALLSIRPLVYTGRISYGWYLWHWPVLEIGRYYLKPFPGYGLCLVSVAYVLAVLSFHLVESPILKLKTRFKPPKQISASIEDDESATPGLPVVL